MNAASGTASASRRARATSRPRRQHSISVSTIAPTSSGNQPPTGILCTFAATKVGSRARNSPAIGSSNAQDQPQTQRATAATRIEVTNMSPATAMPYALASASELRKPMTSARTAVTGSEKLTLGGNMKLTHPAKWLLRCGGTDAEGGGSDGVSGFAQAWREYPGAGADDRAFAEYGAAVLARRRDSG